jgi:folate-binding protein YgfZ
MLFMITVGQLDPASPDAPVAAHYGDPLREQRIPGALVDRSHRDIFAITGPERLEFLHNLTTQHLLHLGEGQATQALLLSPHGHIEHHMWITSLGDRLIIDTEPGAGQALQDFLLKMRFFTKVEFEPTDLRVYSVLNVAHEEPDVLAVPPAKFAAGVVAPRPTSIYPVRVEDGLVKRHTSLGIDLLVPRAEASAGVWAYEAHRVAAGIARLGFDTDHRALPSEVDLTAVAVHLEKGCYRGQETVARVHHLGRPPRALRLLDLDGVTTDHLPAPGTPIMSGERQVGFVGTAVRHFEEGPIALGLVKRNISAETPLIAGDSTVAVQSTDE